MTLVLDRFTRTCLEQRFANLAYCFMPDHVHLLVEGEAEDSDGRLFVRRAKQFSGFHYQQVFGRKLWQRYGYERTLRADEDTLGVARYIVENPVRAGLVRDARQYRFVGSSRYTVEAMLEAMQLQGGWYRSG